MRIAVLLLGLMLVLSTAALANGNVTPGVGTTPTTPPTITPTTPTTTTTDTGVTTTTTTTTPVGAGPTTTTVPTGTMQPCPPGTTMTGMVETMSPEVETFNTAFLSSYYGLSSAAISNLRAQGFTWGEINFISNVAARTQRPITEIAAWRMQGATWPEIASRYNVALTDITTPLMPTSRVAGFVGETTMMTSTMPPYYLTDRYGNPVLTPIDAQSFMQRGYDWRSIAVAANISARTGVPVGEILAMTDRGMTFTQIALEYGLRPENVLDVSLYPYSRDAVRGASYDRRVSNQYQSMTHTYGVTPAPIGAGPTYPTTPTTPSMTPTMTQPIPGSTPTNVPGPSPSTTTPSY